MTPKMIIPSNKDELASTTSIMYLRLTIPQQLAARTTNDIKFFLIYIYKIDSLALPHRHRRLYFACFGTHLAQNRTHKTVRLLDVCKRDEM